MKYITEAFSEGNYKQLKEVKGNDRTWREAILEEFGVDEE